VTAIDGDPMEVATGVVDIPKMLGTAMRIKTRTLALQDSRKQARNAVDGIDRSHYGPFY
jgi:hypothetical protein